MPQEIPTTSWREPALFEVDADFDLAVEKQGHRIEGARTGLMRFAAALSAERTYRGPGGRAFQTPPVSGSSPELNLSQCCGRANRPRGGTGRARN